MRQFEKRNEKLEDILERTGHHADVAVAAIAATLLHPAAALAAVLFSYVLANRKADGAEYRKKHYLQYKALKNTEGYSYSWLIMKS